MASNKREVTKTTAFNLVSDQRVKQKIAPKQSIEPSFTAPAPLARAQTQLQENTTLKGDDQNFQSDRRALHSILSLTGVEAGAALKQSRLTLGNVDHRKELVVAHSIIQV